jgi:hypothetical protein
MPQLSVHASSAAPHVPIVTSEGHPNIQLACNLGSHEQSSVAAGMLSCGAWPHHIPKPIFVSELFLSGSVVLEALCYKPEGREFETA